MIIKKNCVSILSMIAVFAVSDVSSANLLFFRAISDSAFNVATFTRSGTEAGDLVTYDGVHYTPIPEPSTLLLLGSDLLGIAGITRRRKS